MEHSGYDRASDIIKVLTVLDSYGVGAWSAHTICRAGRL